MSMLAVKAPTRQHLRSKSATRGSRSDEQSDREARPFRREGHRTARDAYDDAATLAFVRRVLCAGRLRSETDNSSASGLEGILPPLTSSNDIDLQLYAIIAVIIKDFVQTWYSKITPDHEFVDHVIQIIAHCTRGLEQRIRRVDLESLLFDEIPALLNQHADGFRTARASARSVSGQALKTDAHTIYHAMNPHPALSPVPNEDNPGTATEQRANEQVWRQLLIEGVLDNLLPPEDLQNPCLKAMVSEIFSEMIISNVLGGKVCQGWFLWDVTSKVIQAVRPARQARPGTPETKKSHRLDQYGLLPDLVPERIQVRPRRRLNSIYALIINVGWELLRVAALLISTVRSAYQHLSEAAKLPSRSEAGQRTLDADAAPGHGSSKVAVLDMTAWTMPMHILNLNIKMPWLSGLVSLIQYYALYGPRTVGGVDSSLDRLIASHLTNIFSAERLPSLLKTVRSSLFPNNSLAAGAPPPSTPAEVAAVRQRCAQNSLSLIPPAVRGMYFGRTDEAERVRIIEEDILVLFEDAYLNKHLVFAIVEVVLCRIFPEMVTAEDNEATIE